MNEELNLLEETTDAVVETVETSAIGTKGVKGALVAGLAVVTLGLGFLAYKIIKLTRLRKLQLLYHLINQMLLKLVILKKTLKNKQKVIRIKNLWIYFKDSFSF